MGGTTMPKATVDEDRQSTFAKDDVGSSAKLGQRLSVNPIPKAQAMEFASEA